MRSSLAARGLLALTLAIGACGARPSPPPAAPTPAALAMGDAVEGRLDPRDPEEEPGHRIDGYDVALTAGQPTRLRVRAESFDPWMRVTGPDGLRVENDDARPGETTAAIQLVPDVSGTYRVEVSSALRHGEGAYVLDVGERPAPDAMLVLGEVARGELAASMLRTLDFEGQGGARVTLTLEAGGAAATWIVLGPHGERWTGTSDAPTTWVLPRTAAYRVLISGAADAPTAYTLTTHVTPPVMRDPTSGAALGPLAGPSGRGRVLGLFAGISDYAPPLEALYGAADDARLLAEALRAAGVQRDDEQIVLLDHAATRAALVEGLRALAARARPDDVVIVFFAGHGDQTPTEAPGEIDGRDEVLVLADEALTDDALAAALAPIDALTLVAIDACHSGGFADDVIDRPGRVGLFSSEEDAISDTAEAHRAGGYLSWFLRRGVLGEADRDPHDGALGVGELTDHLLRGFAADDTIINPPGLGDTTQHVVIRRGAVPWSTLLWSYPRGPDLALPRLPEVGLESAPP